MKKKSHIINCQLCGRRTRVVPPAKYCPKCRGKSFRVSLIIRDARVKFSNLSRLAEMIKLNNNTGGSFRIGVVRPERNSAHNVWWAMMRKEWGCA